MSDKKTATEIYMRSELERSRGHRAAMSRGWWRDRETEAFIDGARWMLEQMQGETSVPIAPMTGTIKE